MKHEARNGRTTRNGDPFDVDIQSCSAMDCTGLIPSLPQNEAEIEHYNELYPFLPGYGTGLEKAGNHSGGKDPTKA